MQVRKQQLELDMEQQTVPNRKRSTSRLYLSPCLLKFYAEYIMRNAGLEEAQVGFKIAGRNNLRYADDSTLMAESEEELKSLLMKVKEESEKVGLKLNIQCHSPKSSHPLPLPKSPKDCSIHQKKVFKTIADLQTPSLFLISWQICTKPKRHSGVEIKSMELEARIRNFIQKILPRFNCLTLSK